MVYPDKSTDAVLQIRVIPAKEKTTVSFHHEYLPNGAGRTGMKAFWENVLQQIILRVL
ncbi:hypothetical protein J2T02_002781 [Chitinophaga terrae (ex Kim and Jung 2007)]|uniref:hypothetical protein n=1 Tax=Chitinophaga terrae (ex Kim and Jung 2007) TaxID=408074 RepID=UPI002786106D|nr:hypothetical protein [Chitinophaga terrae (ex Kim and Jung 2007)]MDQ0107660.1 hypothetical protein [Chitinophaga terrae (ex Kim and Jung 2007)]